VEEVILLLEEIGLVFLIAIVLLLIILAGPYIDGDKPYRTKLSDYAPDSDWNKIHGRKTS
jgi:hypothetical protein